MSHDKENGSVRRNQLHLAWLQRSKAGCSGIFLLLACPGDRFIIRPVVQIFIGVWGPTKTQWPVRKVMEFGWSFLVLVGPAPFKPHRDATFLQGSHIWRHSKGGTQTMKLLDIRLRKWSFYGFWLSESTVVKTWIYCELDERWSSSRLERSCAYLSNKTDKK